MQKPTLHVVSPFHTVLNTAHTHCAFSTKTQKFSRMMQMFDWPVVEYSNGVSESLCKQKVQILTQDELDRLAGKREHTQFHGATAVIGSPHWCEFDRRLRLELGKRVVPGDFIIHPFGRSHAGLLKDFPQQLHAEASGCGYPDRPWGAFRAYESSQWMHYHAGQHLTTDGDGKIAFRDNIPIMGKNGHNFADWVIPNYFEIEQWTPKYEPGKYIVFLGRISVEKGINTIKAIAEHLDEKIVMAGQGNIEPWKHPNIEYIGPVLGRDRDALLGNAKVMLCPTEFVEPWCGSAVESQLVGTPVLTTDWGAFHTNMEHGKTGWRCRVLGDWLEGIRRAPSLDRKYIADRARSLYSLETCGAQVDKMLRQIMTLAGKGWYSTEPIWVT